MSRKQYYVIARSPVYVDSRYSVTVCSQCTEQLIDSRKYVHDVHLTESTKSMHDFAADDSMQKTLS